MFLPNGCRSRDMNLPVVTMSTTMRKCIKRIRTILTCISG